MKNKRTHLFTGLLALALLSVQAASAADYNWLPAWGKWEDAANWDAGAVPVGSGITAEIANNRACLMDRDTPYSGLTREFRGELTIGNPAGTGTLDVVSSGGEVGFIYAKLLAVGDGGTGVVNLSGHAKAWFRADAGSTVQGRVDVGINGGQGTLNISNGYSTGRSLTFGDTGGRGVVNMSGGQLTADRNGLHVGQNGGTGILNLNGGTLNAWLMTVYGSGTTASEFNVLDASTTINVLGNQYGRNVPRPHNGIAFGEGADSNVKLTAVPGAQIQFTGNCDADVEFKTAGPAAAADMAGLNNTTFVFSKNNRIADHAVDPPGDRFSQLEVACADIGRKADGFVGNFALGGLTLLTPGAASTDLSGTNTVQLVDNHANAGVPGAEALYVKNLVLEERTVLDLNGKKLYYLDGDFAAGTVLNGAPVQVPPSDPTTLIVIR
ncbi:MAG: hypothetical protein ACOX9C_11710 [Kiritimatiellia bacterium]|jgi:hypothetical protein